MFPVVLAGFTAFLDLYATQPLLPLLMRVFDASHFTVSLTMTASTLAVAIAAPVVGRVADLAGRKRVIVGSAFILAVATALAATSANLMQFIGWRFVQGLVTPGIFAITIAYIHEEYPAWYAGRATAAYVSGTVMGGFCGRVLVGLMAASVSWQLAFATLAAVNVAAAAAIALWLPRERLVASRPAERRARHVAAAAAHNRRLFATNVVGFCVLFSQVAMFTYVTFHLEAPPYGLSTAALGYLFIVYLFGAAVTPIAGSMRRPYGHRTGLAIGMGVGSLGAALTLASPLAADCRRARPGRQRRVHRAGHREQLHRRRDQRGSRACRGSLFVGVLSRRHRWRRAAIAVLGQRGLDGLRAAGHRGAGRDTGHRTQLLASGCTGLRQGRQPCSQRSLTSSAPSSTETSNGSPGASVVIRPWPQRQPT